MQVSRYRFFVLMVVLASPWATSARAQAFSMTLTEQDFVLTNTFSEVSQFSISLRVDLPPQPGAYENPPLGMLVYQVSGELTEGTPSGFQAFQLERELSGEEFYALGRAAELHRERCCSRR